MHVHPLLDFHRKTDFPSFDIVVNNTGKNLASLSVATQPAERSRRIDSGDTFGPGQHEQILAHCRALESRNATLEARLLELGGQAPAPAGFSAGEAVTARRRCTAYDAELLDKLEAIILQNLEEPDFNVDKMCRMVHLSHMHFIRKVKQLTGLKPLELLKSYRLKRAKELLLQQKLTVAEIAYRVGYDMPNSFSRAFKKEFGINPTAYVG